VRIQILLTIVSILQTICKFEMAFVEGIKKFTEIMFFLIIFPIGKLLGLNVKNAAYNVDDLRNSFVAIINRLILVKLDLAQKLLNKTGMGNEIR
jgi:DMSO reductase anchor subunit